MDNNEVLQKARTSSEKARETFTNYIETIYNPAIEEGIEETIETVTKERDRLYQQTEYWGTIVRAIILYTERATPVTKDYIESFQYLNRIQIVSLFKELNEELQKINDNIYIRACSGLYSDENVFMGEICLKNTEGFTETILKPNELIIKIIEKFFLEKNIKIKFNEIKNCFTLINVVIDLYK